MDEVKPIRGVVPGASAAKLAKQGIEAKGDCGPFPRVSGPGSTFSCTATDQTGKSSTLYYKVDSDKGSLSMQTTPFE